MGEYYELISHIPLQYFNNIEDINCNIDKEPL